MAMQNSSFRCSKYVMAAYRVNESDAHAPRLFSREGPLNEVRGSKFAGCKLYFIGPITRLYCLFPSSKHKPSGEHARQTIETLCSAGFLERRRKGYTGR